MKEQFAREKLDEIIPSDWQKVKVLGYQMAIPTQSDLIGGTPILNVAAQ